MRCPFCKEDLFDGASQCSNCGQILPDVDRPGEQTTGENTPEARTPSSAPSKEIKKQAEPAPEGGVNKNVVMIFVVLAAVVVFGILATIAFPKLMKYREESGCEAAKTDIKLAYTMAQAFYGKHQNQSLSKIGQLEEFGFKPSKNVNLQITSGGSYDLVMSSKHSSCKQSYYIDYLGNVSDTEPVVAVTVPVPPDVSAPAATSLPVSTTAPNN